MTKRLMVTRLLLAYEIFTQEDDLFSYIAKASSRQIHLMNLATQQKVDNTKKDLH